MFFFFGICVSPGPHGSNTLDADWEEHQAPSTPVRKLFTGLSRRKALRIDMSVSAEKTAGTTLFTVLTHTSNIYIFKLSLRWKLLQTHCYSDNKEPRWGRMPWDCSALALNCVTSQMPQPLGSCSYLHGMGGADLLKAQPVRHHRSPKPPGLIPWVLHPKPGCRWASSGLETRLPSHRGLCLSTMASLASGLGQGRLQVPTAQEDAISDWAAPRSRFPSSKGVCLLGQSLCVCAVPWAASLHSYIWFGKQSSQHISASNHFQEIINTSSVQIKAKHYHRHYL